MLLPAFFDSRAAAVLLSTSCQENRRSGGYVPPASSTRWSPGFRLTGTAVRRHGLYTDREFCPQRRKRWGDSIPVFKSFPASCIALPSIGERHCRPRRVRRRCQSEATAGEHTTAQDTVAASSMRTPMLCARSFVITTQPCSTLWPRSTGCFLFWQIFLGTVGAGSEASHSHSNSIEIAEEVICAPSIGKTEKSR